MFLQHDLELNVQTILYFIHIISLLNTKSESRIVLWQIMLSFSSWYFPHSQAQCLTYRRHSIKYEDTRGILKLLWEELLQFVLYQTNFIKMNCLPIGFPQKIKATQALLKGWNLNCYTPKDSNLSCPTAAPLYLNSH